MANQYTAIIEQGDDGYFLATSPEVPAACGQGRSVEEAKEDLASSIAFVLEFERDRAFADMDPRAVRDVVTVA
ncbi:MAG: type II toxin-antitoxin system HicB family antitoxin [Dehalococcoidia bacterium]